MCTVMNYCEISRAVVEVKRRKMAVRCVVSRERQSEPEHGSMLIN